RCRRSQRCHTSSGGTSRDRMPSGCTVSRDHYEVLGVERNASDDEIRRAYRELARRHHPDSNRDDPEAEERFKEIGAAYEVLRDPEKRRRYDVFGDGGSAAGGRADGAFGFGDLFGAFFGGEGFA